MFLLKKKMATANHVLQHHGARGIAAVLVQKPVDWWQGLDRRIRGEGLWQDSRWHRFRGRLIGLLGSTVKIEGCRFSLDSPVIPAHIKSYVASSSYEAPERKVLRQFLNSNLPVIEFGGSIGVVSCLTNKRLHKSKEHVVVEANPDMIPVLEKNRDLNECRFVVRHRAVAYGCNEITFYRNPIFLSSNLNNQWGESPEEAVRVPTITLQNIIDEFSFKRVTLICDIEGAEFDLVQHESDILRERVADFMVEVHRQLGDHLADSMFDKLGQIGFRHVYDHDGTYFFRNSRFDQA